MSAGRRVDRSRFQKLPAREWPRLFIHDGGRHWINQYTVRNPSFYAFEVKEGIATHGRKPWECFNVNLSQDPFESLDAAMQAINDSIAKKEGRNDER